MGGFPPQAQEGWGRDRGPGGKNRQKPKGPPGHTTPPGRRNKCACFRATGPTNLGAGLSFGGVYGVTPGPTCRKGPARPGTQFGARPERESCSTPRRKGAHAHANRQPACGSAPLPRGDPLVPPGARYPRRANRVFVCSGLRPTTGLGNTPGPGGVPLTPLASRFPLPEIWLGNITPPLFFRAMATKTTEDHHQPRSRGAWGFDRNSDVSNFLPARYGPSETGPQQMACLGPMTPSQKPFSLAEPGRLSFEGTAIGAPLSHPRFGYENPRPDPPARSCPINGPRLSGPKYGFEGWRPKNSGPEFLTGIDSGLGRTPPRPVGPGNTRFTLGGTTGGPGEPASHVGVGGFPQPTTGAAFFPPALPKKSDAFLRRAGKTGIAHELGGVPSEPEWGFGGPTGFFYDDSVQAGGWKFCFGRTNWLGNCSGPAGGGANPGHRKGISPWRRGPLICTRNFRPEGRLAQTPRPTPPKDLPTGPRFEFRSELNPGTEKDFRALYRKKLCPPGPGHLIGICPLD